jgi:hypothetical protein
MVENDLAKNTSKAAGSTSTAVSSTFGMTSIVLLTSAVVGALGAVAFLRLKR